MVGIWLFIYFLPGNTGLMFTRALKVSYRFIFTLDFPSPSDFRSFTVNHKSVTKNGLPSNFRNGNIIWHPLAVPEGSSSSRNGMIPDRFLREHDIIPKRITANNTDQMRSSRTLDENFSMECFTLPVNQDRGGCNVCVESNINPKAGRLRIKLKVKLHITFHKWHLIQ